MSIFSLRSTVRSIGTFAAAATMLLATVGTAAAVSSFPVHDVLAVGPQGGADASIGADGVTRGFIAATLGGAGEAGISYFEAPSHGAPVKTPTPWIGAVLSTAWDGVSAVYVVFSHNGTLNIAKRITTTGTFSAVTTLATGGIVSPLENSFQASVVASAGKWWVVWSRPGHGSTGPVQLYQRHTLLGSGPTIRITATSATIADTQPVLAYRPGKLTLAWTRTSSPAVGGPAVVRIATSTGGPWSSSTLSTGGVRSLGPDIGYDGNTLYAAWTRDGSVVQADGQIGSMTTHTFPGSNAVRPKIAASGGHVFVGWLLVSGSTAVSNRFAQRDSGAWTVVALNGGAPASYNAVLGYSNQARVVYRDGEASYLDQQ